MSVENNLWDQCRVLGKYLAQVHWTTFLLIRSTATNCFQISCLGYIIHAAGNVQLQDASHPAALSSAVAIPLA